VGDAMLSSLPSAKTMRCSTVSLKGAKILTVLLVVVLSVANICFTLEIVWLQPGDFAFFYRASHPDESSLENKNGRGHGKIPGQRPFWFGKYSAVFYVLKASCIGMERLRNWHNLPIHVTVSAILLSMEQIAATAIIDTAQGIAASAMLKSSVFRRFIQCFV
jgi:hypothetical protein